jgi:hypothetical protein
MADKHQQAERPDKLKKDELVTAIEKANARASRQARER